MIFINPTSGSDMYVDMCTHVYTRMSTNVGVTDGVVQRSLCLCNDTRSRFAMKNDINQSIAWYSKLVHERINMHFSPHIAL